jgi:hypothetical protein
MAHYSLPHFGSDSYYQIGLKELENLHFKISQTHSVLSFLDDWVSENPNCSLPLDQKGRMSFTLFLLITVMEQAKALLPEV